jgi:hypothetical protein
MNPQLGLFPRSPGQVSARAAAEGWAAQALMPHRRALGEKAVDQLAGSELGRLALRGELEPVLATARGARHWRGTSRAFVQTCSAPAPIAAGRWARCG